MTRLAIMFVLSFIAVASSAIAEPTVYQLPPETAELKPGPGVETAAVCQACHSADYIATQPPGQGKAFWQAEVQKMIKVYKAPIADSDASVIANYLAATY
ncbi:MAG TPA: cytochrome c [Roseiarcus sp.]|jgi:predicted secreted protein|nr:cytochrome c [Roseiarcus sp.]